jgi:hypothetical protein
MASSAGRFLRDNAFLAAAVCLPLVVVLFFLLSAALPRWTVPPPRYDVLLRTRAYDQIGPMISVDFVVQEGALQAMVRPIPPNTSPNRSRLWLFDHEQMTVREISTALPERLADGETSRTIPIEALAGRRVVAESKAPDGYEVQNRSSSSPGLIGDLFGMRRYDQTVSLVNRGRVIPIQMPTHTYEYPVFVCWVIE